MGELTEKRKVTYLALTMQYLWEQGVSLEEVKHAADCWWQIKSTPLPTPEGKEQR